MNSNTMVVGTYLRRLMAVIIFSLLTFTGLFAQGDPNKQCRDVEGYQPTVDDNVTCLTTTAHSNASGWFVDGHWDFFDGSGSFSDADDEDPDVYIDSTSYGWNIIRWVEYGSSSTDTVCWDTVWIYSPFIKSYAGEDQDTCAQTELAANDPSPGTGTWSSKSGLATFSNVHNPTAIVSNIPQPYDVLYWTVENTEKGVTCTDVDSVTIANHTPYPVDAGVADTTCVNDSIQLMATEPPAGCTGTWSVLSGSGTFGDVHAYDTWVTNLAPGLNVLQWKVENDTYHCADSDTVAIYNFTIHIVDHTDPGPWCTDYATLNVSVTPSGFTGLWSVVASPATISDPTNTSTSVSGLQFGANTFRYVAELNGCKDSIDVTITASFVDAVATATSPVCNDTTQLIGNDPSAYSGSGHWEAVGGGSTIDNSTAQSTFAYNLVHGENFFIWVITNSDGCSDVDTVKVLDLEPSDAVIATADQTVCDSTVVLTANAPVYSDETGYWTSFTPEVTFSPDASHATVTAEHLQPGNNVFVWHIDNGVCPEKTDTVTINYDQVIANAGLDQTVCTGDSVVLGANVPAPGQTGTWGVVQGNATFSDVHDPSATAYDLRTDVVNILTWTVSDGFCSDTDSVSITNLTPTTALVAPDTGYTCDGTYNLAANTPTSGTGYWTGPSGVTFSPDASTANATVSNLPPGTSALVWHITTGGSCPESTDTIFIVYEYVEADAGGPYDSTCNGSIQLAASLPPGTTGEWWAPSPITFDDPTRPDAIVSNLDYGANVLRWTVTTAHGCQAWDTVTVYNWAVGEVNAGLDQHVCSNTATLNATPVTNGNGLWTTISGATILDPTNNITDVINLDPGANTFYWTVTNGNCSDTDTVIIYNDSVSVAEAGHWQIVCTDTAQLAANSPTIGTGQWSSVIGLPSFDNPNSPVTVVRNLSRGLNVLRWQISNAYCSSEDTVHVYNMSVEASYAGEQPVVTCDGTAELVASNPSGQNITDPYTPAHGLWTILSGVGNIVDPTNFNTTVYDLALDTNILEWRVYNDYCWDSVHVVVVNNTPEQAYAGVDTVVCSTSYYLNATPPSRGTGHWVVLAGGGTIADPTLHNSRVDGLSYACQDSVNDWLEIPGAVNVFEWVVDYNGCTSSDTVYVINGLPAYVNAGEDTVVCSRTVNLYALDHGECAQEHWWTAVPPNGLTFKDPYTFEIDSTDFNARVEGLQKDTTAFIWHMQNTYLGVTCLVTDTVYIVSLGLVDDINAGQDEAFCSTEYHLNAAPPSTVIADAGDSVRGFWTVIYGSGEFDDSSQYNTYVRNLGYMTNILRWTLVNETKHCVATDDIYLTNALPSNAVVFSDDTIVCENTTTLTANRPVRGVGHWEVIGGSAYITGDSCNTWNCRTYAHDLSPGQNTFLWVVENSYYGVETDPDTLTCRLTDTAYVFYNQVIADAGDTAYTKCADTLVLNANQPDSTVGMWYVAGGTGLFRTTDANYSYAPQDTVYNLVRGKNTLVWRLSRTVRGVTCTDEDQLIVWDNLPPDPDAGLDQTICADSAYLSANPDVRNVYYLNITNDDTIAVALTEDYWTAVGGIATFRDSTQPSTWIRNLPPGVYTNAVWHKVLYFTDSLTGFTQRCELTDTVKIYNNSVTAVAGDVPGQPICGTEDTLAYVVLNATPPAPGQSGVWSFVTGPRTPTILNPTNPTTGVRGLDNGTNIFRWTVSSTVNSVTCSADDYVTVEVRIPTTARVADPDSFEVCSNEALLQANNPIHGVGHWEAVYPYSGNIDDPGNYVTYVRNLWGGITKWAWVIDNDGCTSSDTITVLNNTVYADADDRIDPNVVNICQDSFKLSATDPNIFNTSNSPDSAKGHWTASTAVTFDDDSLYNTYVRNLSNTTANVLVWTITKGGCSASDNVIIYNNEFTIDAAVTDPDNIIEICTDSVQMDGEQPGENGHGQWTVINGGGSFVDDTLYNTWVRNVSASGVNQYVWTVTRKGCTARDTVTIINNMVTAQAGPDQVVCEDTTSMQASLPSGATGHWTIDLGSGTFADANDPRTHVDGLERDVNQFVWTVTKGICSATDTVVIINNHPEDAIAEDDKEVCDDSTVLVVAVPPATDTGYWKLVSGSGYIYDTTSYNAPVSGLQPGVNKFVWIVRKANCTTTDTLVITNNQVAANAGLDDTVCTDTARIAALGPSQFYPYQGVGHWSDAGGTGVTFDNPNDSITIVRNLAQGANQLRWTVTLGSCSASDDIIIVNRQVHAYASDITTCSMPVTLTGNDPVSDSGIWRNIGGLGTVVDPTLYNSEYRDLPNQTSNVLRWVVYNESCADSVDILVTNNNFVANAGPWQIVCSDTAVLNAQLNSGATGTWSYDAGNATFDDANDPQTTVRDLAKGNNILRWTVTWNGCTAYDTVTIVNNTPEEAVITGPTDPETCDSTATLTARSYSSTTHITSKHWEIVEGGGHFVGDSTDYTAQVEDLLPGNNRILWIIENGRCSDTDQIIITNNAVTANAGDDLYVCDTIAKLYAEVPIYGTGHWETAASGVTIEDPTNNRTIVHGFGYGMTTFNWIVQQGSCRAEDQTAVYNYQVFAVANDTVVCDDSVQLHANDPSAQSANGQWFIIAGPGTLVDPTAYNTYIYDLEIGATTTLRWKVWNDYCVDIANITVTNNNFYVNAYPDTVICSDSIQLIGTDPTPGTGNWVVVSGGSGTHFSDDANDTTVVYELTRGENKLAWIVTKGGCTNSDTVTIINSLPSDAIITGDRTPETCDSSISLSADKPTPYYATTQYWRVLGRHYFVTDSTLFDVTIDSLDPGETQIIWTVVNGKCVDTAMAIVTNNAVRALAGDDKSVCDSSTVIRASDPLTIPPYQGSGTWTANRPVTIVDPTNYQTAVHGLPVGQTVFTWRVTKGSCSAEDDLVVTNNQVFAVAYDTTTCTDEAPLVGNDPYSTGGSGLWSIIAGDGTITDPTAPSTTITGLDYQSTVTLTWYVTNGTCEDYDTITVVSNNFYVNAGIDDTVCSDTAYLHASDLPGPGATGQWSVVGGSGTFENSTSNITMVTGLLPGANTLRWTVTWHGCTHYDEVVIYNSEPSDPVILTQNDTVVCDGQITLRADEPTQGHGYWEQLVGTGLSDTVGNNIVTVTGLSQNNNLFRWTVTKGSCAKYEDITVINNQVIANAGLDDTTCYDTIRLAAAPPVAGATGLWEDVSSIGVTFSDASDPNAIARNIPQQSVVTLSWTVTKGGCSDVDYVRIYNMGVTATASNQVVCDTSVVLDGNDPATFTMSPTHGLWQAISGTGIWFDDPTNPTTTVNGLPYSSITTLQWKLWNDAGCADSVQITIDNRGFQVFAGGDQAICGDTAQLNGTEITGGSGTWSIVSAGTSASITFDDENSPSTIVRGLGFGDNILQWKVTKGACSDSDQVVITNKTPYPVNIISPANGTELCVDTVQVEAQAPTVGTGRWVLYGGANIIRGSYSSLQATVGNLLPDSNKITWLVDNDGCSVSADVYVINNQVASYAGVDDTVCTDSTTLAATRPEDLYGGTGHWEAVPSGVTFSDATSPYSKVYNLVRGVNELVWVVEKGSCDAADTVKIYNYSVYASALNVTTCDTQARMNANNPAALDAHGIWSAISSSAITFDDDTLYNTWVYGLPYESVTTLQWKVYNDYGCADSVYVQVVNNGFALSAGTDKTVCADTALLQGDDPAPGTGEWSVSSGYGVFDNSTSATTVVRDLNPGANIFTWTVTKNGCTESADVTITNNSFTISAGPDQALCTDETQLNADDPATVGGTGHWERVSGAGTFDDPNQYDTWVRGLRRGENTFRWIVEANGCTAYDDVVITNNSFDVNAGFDQTVCADTAVLKPEPIEGGSGTWTVQGSSAATIDDPSADTTVVRNLDRGVNIFRWTVTKNGCTFYDEVAITNDLPNEPVIYTLSDTVCIDSVRLEARAPAADETGLWTYTGSGGDIVDPTNNVTDVVNLNPGRTEFIWTLTHNGCSLSASVNIVNNMVTANAGSDQLSLCQDYTNLNAVEPTAPAYGWWTKADGQPGEIEDTNSAVTPVRNLGYGENRFVWHVKRGKCSATDTVLIINNSASPAVVGTVPPTCDGTAFLSATPPAYGTGEWSYIGTAPVVIVSPSSANTEVRNLAYGANLFQWTVTNVTEHATCTDDTTLTVLNYQFTIDAGADYIGCDSIVYLQAQTRPEQDSAYWTILTGAGSITIADSTDANSQVIIRQGGSAVLKWTVWEHGCYDEDYVTLQNKGVTAIAFDKETCDSTTTLNAVAPGVGNHGYWTAGYDDITFTPEDTLYNATAHNLHVGANTFIWHVYNDYCSDSTSIVVNYLVPYAYAGTDQEICSDEYNLSANDPAEQGGSGQWSIHSGSGTFDDDTLYNTTVRGLARGENVLVWTVTVRGCSNSDFLTLVNNKPFVNVDNNPMEICDTFAILTGNEPDTANGEKGFWTKITPGPHRFVDSTDNNTVLYGITPGSEIVRWTIVNGRCSAYADLTINNNMIEAYAGEDIEVCADSAQLAAYLPSHATGYWSAVTSGVTIDNSTLFNTWVRNLKFGDNVFSWTVQNGSCVSSDEVTVTNNAVDVDAGDDQTVCQNYATLFGSPPPDSAHGVWRLVGGYGIIVDSTKNVTQVTDLSSGANVFSWTVYNGSCATTDEVIIYNNEVRVDAGAGDQALCASEFELNANPPDPGGVGHWSVVAGYGEIDNPDTNITWVRNLARGENVLRWTVTKDGCTGYDEIVINNITPTQAITIGEKYICEDYTTITGNEPRYGIGYWKLVTSSSSLVTIDDTLANSTVVRNLGLGPNQFAWIIVDTATGCYTSDTVTVYNNSVTAFAGLDQEICTDSFRLQADDPYPNTGVWSTVTAGGTFDDPTDPNTMVRNLPVGVNILRWTVSNSQCSNSDDVIITNNMTTVADAGPDQVSCDGTAILIGNTPDVDEQGLWIKLSGTATIENPTSYWTNVTNLSPGVTAFIWKITRGSCWSADTVLVDNHQIAVDAGHDFEVCQDSAVIQGNRPTGSITGYWTLVGGSGTIDNSTSYITSVYDLGPGANVFRWTLSDGVCSNYDEVVVTNNDPTDPQVCYDTVRLCQDNVNLCANSPNSTETGYWTVAAGNAVFDDSNDPSTLAYDLSNEVTLVWHIVKGGCHESDTMVIVNGSVDAVVAYDSAEACGTEYWLAANEPIDSTWTRYWTLISGEGTIANSTASYTAVSDLGLGANTFRWTVENDMCSNSADVVIVNSKYPVNANLSATNPICDSDVVVLGSPPEAGGVGTWSVAAGSPYITFDDPHSSTTTAHNLGNGATILQWTVAITSVDSTVCTNFDTVVVINNSVYADAGQDVTVCDTDDVGILLANDPATSNGLYGYWTVVSGSVDIADDSSYITTVTHVAYGSNTLKWTVVGNGCQDEDVVIVSNNHFTVSAGIDRTICDTTTVLVGTDPGPDGSGIWTVSGSGWFEDPTNHITRVNGIAPGANTYIWTVTKNGCTAADTVVITNGIPTAIAGGDKTVCEDSTGLDAVVPDVGSGVWSLMSGSGVINDPSSPHTYVTGLAKGDNVFRWTVYNGTCSAYDEVTITNNMVTATAGVDQNVCDTVAYLAADPPGEGGHGVWTIVAGGGRFDDSTLYNTRVVGLHTGINTFRWTVYENGCSNSSEVSIINNGFETYAGDDQIVVTPVATMNAQEPEPGAYGTWTVIAGAGTFDNQHDPATTVTGLQQGVNTYRWTVYNPTTGCSAYDDVNVIYNGFNVDAGDDQIICSDTTKLAAEGVPGANQYWSVVQGSCDFDDPTDPNTVIRNVERGVNILRWNVSKNGFTTYDEVVITNYLFDTYAGEDQVLCDDSTTLDATYMVNYGIAADTADLTSQWQFIAGGGTFVDQNDPNTVVYALSPGQNILRWVVTREDYPGPLACQAEDTVVITYYQLPPTDFATDPENGAGCNPLQITFYNTTPPDTIPGTVYYWNFANMSIVRTNYDDTLTRIFYNNDPEHDSIYPVWLIAEAEVAQGVVCRDTVRKDITVWAVPHAEFIISPRLIYPAANAYIQNLSTRTAQRYQWDFGDGTGEVQDTFVAYFNHDYTPAGWGTYTVVLTVWNEHCHSSDTNVVHVIAPPPRSYPNVSTFKEGCQPLTIPLYPSVLYTTPGVSEYKWIIRDADEGDTVAVLYDEAPVYTFTEPGTFLADIYVTAEGSNPPWSWTYIRTDTIWVHPKPVADFTAEPKQASVNELVHFYNYSQGAVKYRWDFGLPNGQLTSTEKSPVISYPEPGNYFVTLYVESEYGCSDQKTSEEPIVILPEGDILFPSAFSPSSPIDKNKVFKPIYRGEIVEYQLQIYNRWGQLIFVSTDVNIGWDGNINGKPAPQDVYVFKYHVKFRSGKIKEGAGSVTLLR